MAGSELSSMVNNAGYVEGLQSYRGLKVVVAYHLSNRMDLNVYGAFGNSNLYNIMKVDNVEGGGLLPTKYMVRKLELSKRNVTSTMKSLVCRKRTSVTIGL